MMKRLSFDTWLDQSPKKQVLAFLKDHVWSKGLHDGLTKEEIRDIISRYGMLKKAEEEINRVRNMPWPYRVDFLKYDRWVGGGR